MTPLFLIAYALILAIILIAAFVLLNSSRTKGRLARSLDMGLFLVVLPRETPVQGQRPDKELIAVMEQLYASLTNIHSQGWNKFLYGEPYLALEMAVHHVGEEINFYVAVPRAYEQIFEKQVHGLYPTAEVQRVRDYSIFSPQGVQAGAYLRMTADPILPIRTYAKLEADPIGELTTALSKLQREGEGAAIQILIRPSHRTDIRSLAQKVAREMQNGLEFSRALSIARHGKKKEEKKPENNLVEPPKVVTAFEDELIKALQNKASRPLFDANIRLLVSAADDVRARQLLNDVSSAFVQFNAPDLNGFSVNMITDAALDKLIFNYAFRIFEDRQTLYLSSDELTSVYHFPLPTSGGSRVRMLKSKTAEPPANLPDTGVVIGKSVFRGQEQLIRMGDIDRRRHLYLIGQTGTGKSSLMKTMLQQDIAEGKGVCVIDPHGEFAEYVLSVVPKERADDVVYFNPGDIDRPLGLNILEVDPSKPEQKTFIANEFFTIMRTIYKDLPEAFGPMFEQYYKNSVLLLMDVFQKQFEDNGSQLAGIEDQRPTLADIPRVLTDTEFRHAKLDLEPNPLVKNFWLQEAEKTGGEAALANMAPYINSKLSPFLANEFLRPIIVQKTSAFDFRDVIDTGKILIVNLSKGRIGEMNANLLGMLVVSKLLMAALSRIDITDEEQRRDFYLYIDEFQNVTTPSIATILSEARKYRLDLIIAHQYIKQLQDQIRDAVFGNVGSTIAFRVGPDDAEFLKGQFEPVFSSADLMNIDNFNAHVRLLINNQTARPFNIQTIREPEGLPEIAEALADVSRLRYGRPRADVEAEIRASYQSLMS